MEPEFGLPAVSSVVPLSIPFGHREFVDFRFYEVEGCLDGV